MAQAKKPETFSLLSKCINGGVAGIVGVTCIFPLDMAKTRLQNQQLGPNGEKMYKNLFDCFKKSYQAEGYFAMYRGSAVNILLITPEKAIKLASNDLFRYHLMAPDGSLPVYKQMIAGGMAGACQITITTPMELLKLNMQDQGRVRAAAKAAGKEIERVTAKQVAAKLIRENGIFGLYRGVGPCAMRDISFSMIYFPMFSYFSSLGPRTEKGEAVFWCNMLAGLGAGSIAAFVDTPLDVVKTRIQTINKAPGEREFNGIFDCLAKTLKYEGIRALFKGGMCRVMVISPLFAIVQTVYFLGVGESIVGFFRNPKETPK